MAIAPVTPVDGAPSSIIPQDSFVGDDGSAILALMWAKSDVNVNTTAVTNPVNMMQSASTGAAITDHSDWMGASEPVRLASSLTAPMAVMFQYRFQWSDASGPEFLAGLVDATATRALVPYGCFVFSA